MISTAMNHTSTYNPNPIIAQEEGWHIIPFTRSRKFPNTKSNEATGKFQDSDMIEVPGEGQSGGMAVLWDTSLVNVNNFVKRNNEIHALIEVVNAPSEAAVNHP
nr:uncharacterized protein LOC117279048 isoform X2 [Nicotiana tomentosiformis]